MGIREKINQHKGAAAGVAIAVIILALIFATLSVTHNKPKLLSQGYFTDDDGKSFFADSVKNVPPFDHGGKEAVLAFVFYCPHSGNFVAYMKKYPPEVKASMEEAIQQGMLARAATALVKRPGTTDGGDGHGWYDIHSQQGHDIEQQIACPDGSTDSMKVVYP